MPSSGILTATQFLQVGDGTVYTSATNAMASDGVFATVALGAGGGAEGLALYTYGASVPAYATILGVEALVTAKSSVGATTNAEVNLINNFSVISTTKTTANFTTSNATQTLGSSSDLWSATITPTIANDPTFGIVIYAATVSAATFSLDSVQVNIYYTLAPNSLMMMGVGI